jgi:predicted kinase
MNDRSHAPDDGTEGHPATAPYLIFVTGRPAAGKTTLANWLAQELQIPVVSKDSIREMLFGRLGWKDRPWAQLLGRAGIDLMFYFAAVQLKAGRSLILDNAFDPALSVPRFRDLTGRYQAMAIQIICNAGAETLFERFKASLAMNGSWHLAFSFAAGRPTHLLPACDRQGVRA